MPPPSDPVLPWLLGRGYPKRLKNWPEPNCWTFLAKKFQFKEFIRTKFNRNFFGIYKSQMKAVFGNLKIPGDHLSP